MYGRLIAFVIFLFSSPLFAANGFHTNTGQDSERIDFIPISIGDAPYTYHVIYSQKLENLKRGQILQVMAEMEVTEQYNYNVQFVTYALLAHAQTEPIQGVKVSAANGENVTNNRHHMKRVVVGTYEITEQDEGTRYLNIVGQAASTAARDGHELRVERNYGRLSVLRWNTNGTPVRD